MHQNVNIPNFHVDIPNFQAMEENDQNIILKNSGNLHIIPIKYQKEEENL